MYSWNWKCSTVPTLLEFSVFPHVLNGLQHKWDLRWCNDVSMPFFVIKRRSFSQQTYLSAQFRLCTSGMELDVILRSLKSSVSHLRRQRHDCRGRHGYHETRAARLPKGIQVRVSTLSQYFTMHSRLQQVLCQENIHWKVKTAITKKHWLRTNWHRWRDSAVTQCHSPIYSQSMQPQNQNYKSWDGPTLNVFNIMNTELASNFDRLVDSIDNKAFMPKQVLTISERLIVAYDQSSSDVPFVTAMYQVNYCEVCLYQEYTKSKCPLISYLEMFIGVRKSNFHNLSTTWTDKRPYRRSSVGLRGRRPFHNIRFSSTNGIQKEQQNPSTG